MHDERSRRKEEERGAEKVLEEIMAEKFPFTQKMLIYSRKLKEFQIGYMQEIHK